MSLPKRLLFQISTAAPMIFQSTYHISWLLCEIFPDPDAGRELC